MLNEDLAVPVDPFVLAIENDLRDVFEIHDVRTRAKGRAVILRGRFLRSPELVFEHASERLEPRGLLPLLRRERGSDVIVVQPAPRRTRRRRVWINAILFVATVVSVLAAGTFQQLPPAAWEAMEAAPNGSGPLALAHVLTSNWTLGLPFATALLGILGVHELGHYFVARRYRLDVSLPYFIPFPINYFTGTLGAVIRIESPFQSRKALFDVGIAGPLAGMVVAVPVVIAGLLQADMVPVGAFEGGIAFGEPLLFRALASMIVGPRPPGFDLEMNPLLMAGWWGFLVTALNLLPVSQLDGGHISYAIFGRHHRMVAWGMFALAAAVALLRSPGYIVMLGLVFLMGLEHPPALNDLTPLDWRRRALGLATLLLFFALVTPEPLVPLG